MKKCLKPYFIVLLAALYPWKIRLFALDSPGYKLIIRAPAEVTIPAKSLRCLYHGEPIFAEKNHCMIPESSFRPFFNIIITPAIIWNANKQPGAIYRDEHMPYKWYTCVLRPHKQQTNIHAIQTVQKRTQDWEIKEIAQNEAPLRIPECSSVIILLNPDLIEKLDAASHKGTHLIHLPALVMKNCVTQPMLQESLDEAEISWLEVKQGHMPVPKKAKKHDSITYICK